MKKLILGLFVALVGAGLYASGTWLHARYQEFLVMRDVVAIILPEVQAKVLADQARRQAEAMKQ